MVVAEMSRFPRCGFTIPHVGWWISPKLKLEDSCVNEHDVALKKLKCKQAERLRS